MPRSVINFFERLILIEAKNRANIGNKSFLKFCLLMHLLDILFFLEGIEREITPPEKSAKHFFFFLK
jgi:hypothetical protein